VRNQIDLTIEISKEDFKKKLDVKDGKKGDKGDPAIVDYEKVVYDVTSKIKVPKDGKDGSPDTPKEVVAKISSLKDEDRLSYESLKDTPDFKMLHKNWGIGYLREVSDVEVISEPTNGYALIWNSSKKKWVAGQVAGGSSWIYDFTPTGTVDGSNLIFTIPDASQVVVYADGVRVKGAGDTYTFLLDTITFEAGKQPFSSISVDYLPL
jgi:hypothetical protein